MSQIPESLRGVEAGPEINIPSRAIKRGSNQQVVNEVLGAMTPLDTPVLEIGSGTGELYRLLDDQYTAAYTGVDSNARYIAFNRADNPGVALIEGDIGELPLDDSSQTTVLALNVVDAVADLTGVVREVNRVLQPGGNFIHFHDRRPNLGFLMRHLPRELAPFPYINNNGYFDRFRLVPREEHQTQAHITADAVNDWLRVADNEPGTIEIVSYFNPDLVTFIAKQVEDQFGAADTSDRLVTPAFKELFTLMVSRALAMDGMEVRIAEDRRAETLVPDEAIYPLLAHGSLRPPYNSGNTFVIDENAHYHFEEERRSALPANQTLVRTMMNVVAASKPR